MASKEEKDETEKKGRLDQNDVSLSSDFDLRPFTVNEVEKEICLQLISSAKESTTPNSNFRTIKRFNSWIILFAIFLGLFAISLGFYFAFLNATTVLSVTERDWHLSGSLIGCCFFAFLASLSLFLSRFFSKVTVRYGDVEAEADSKGTPEKAFDIYLEELFYFFEKTKTNVVIFEDLDRLNAKGLLTDLRNLNSTINSNETIKARGGICFVYAIGEESVWDPKLTAPRSKFFDFIITAQPVLNPFNASEEICSEIECDTNITKQDVMVLSPFIVDRRMATCVLNDYRFYAEKNSRSLKASIDHKRLFGLCVYKNRFPFDFNNFLTGAPSVLERTISFEKADKSGEENRLALLLHSRFELVIPCLQYVSDYHPGIFASERDKNFYDYVKNNSRHRPEFNYLDQPESVFQMLEVNDFKKESCLCISFVPFAVNEEAGYFETQDAQDKIGEFLIRTAALAPKNTTFLSEVIIDKGGALGEISKAGFFCDVSLYGDSVWDPSLYFKGHSDFFVTFFREWISLLDLSFYTVTPSAKKCISLFSKPRNLFKDVDKRSIDVFLNIPGISFDCVDEFRGSPIELSLLSSGKISPSNSFLEALFSFLKIRKGDSKAFESLVMYSDPSVRTFVRNNLKAISDFVVPFSNQSIFLSPDGYRFLFSDRSLLQDGKPPLSDRFVQALPEVDCDSTFVEGSLLYLLAQKKVKFDCESFGAVFNRPDTGSNLKEALLVYAFAKISSDGSRDLYQVGENGLSFLYALAESCVETQLPMLTRFFKRCALKQSAASLPKNIYGAMAFEASGLAVYSLPLLKSVVENKKIFPDFAQSYLMFILQEKDLSFLSLFEVVSLLRTLGMKENGLPKNKTEIRRFIKKINPFLFTDTTLISYLRYYISSVNFGGHRQPIMTVLNSDVVPTRTKNSLAKKNVSCLGESFVFSYITSHPLP